jgi:hypothetical protein
VWCLSANKNEASEADRAFTTTFNIKKIEVGRYHNELLCLVSLKEKGEMMSFGLL